MSPTVYLAGPITGLNFDEAVDWRTHAQRVLAANGIRGVSPMRAKEYLRTAGPLAAEGYYDRPLSNPKGITTRDRFDCTRADLVLVNFVGAERVSIGTVMELGWADANRVPIVVAMEEGNVHQHGMVTEVAGFIVPTVLEAVELTVAILKNSGVDR